MSEQYPAEQYPEEPKKKVQPYDDKPDVEGHLLTPEEKTRLNPDVDELDEGGESYKV